MASPPRVATSSTRSSVRWAREMPATRGRASSWRHVSPAVVAVPLAHRAVRDRIGVGGFRVDVLRQRLLEALLGEAVVGHELGGPERMLFGLSAASDDVDALRPDALDALDLLDVARDLDQRARLRDVRELRVGDLVVMVLPERARVAHAQEEVGVADPAPVENRRLVDDVDALSHQAFRVRGALLVRVVPVVVATDNVQAARLEQVDVALLVQAAAALEEQDFRVFALTRLVDQTRVGLHLEIGEMPAVQEPDQVRGGNDQLSITAMHHGTLLVLRSPQSSHDCAKGAQR